MLNVTDIRVRLVKRKDSKLKALVSVVIDNCLAVHDIKIISGDGGIFVAMPARATSGGLFADIVHPLDTVTREQLHCTKMRAYEDACAEEKE